MCGRLPVIKGDISIHALRKESDGRWNSGDRHAIISIHALRKESDWAERRISAGQQISIHALRKESDSRGASYA